jgi:methyl-accepting chemotaxis protein
LGIVVVVDVVSYLTLTRLIRTVAAVTGSYELLAKLDDVLLQLQNAESGQRGDLITADDGYLQPHHAAIRIVHRDLEDLTSLIERRSSPRQQARLAEQEPLVAAKLAELEETIAAGRRDGFDAAQALVRTHRSRSSASAASRPG